jgi:acyl-coenzyme A thioesterase PaaI-like protein
MPPGASVLTVEYKMNLLSPADGDTILAKGRVVKPGRTLVVTQVDVYSVKQGREKLCALMTQTLMTMAGKSDGPQV